MLIKLYNQFTNTIFNRLSDCNLESKQKINDIKDLEKIMETATGRGYNISSIKLIHNFVSAKATECIYSNGLKYLNSEINYKENNKNTIHTIKQLTITSDYKEYPLINITIEFDKKSIQQFLVSQSIDDSFIPDEEKNINVLKLGIQVKGCCDSFFETFIDTKNDDILLEKYKQTYPISYFENTNLDLLNLCKGGTKYLTIIYCKNKPIFTQLSSKKTDKYLDYNQNIYLDTEEIMNKIKKEINSITETINLIFNEYKNNIKINKK